MRAQRHAQSNENTQASTPRTHEDKRTPNLEKSPLHDSVLSATRCRGEAASKKERGGTRAAPRQAHRCTQEAQDAQKAREAERTTNEGGKSHKLRRASSAGPRTLRSAAPDTIQHGQAPATKRKSNKKLASGGEIDEEEVKSHEKGRRKGD